MKKTVTTEQVRTVQSRISQLTDRIVVLENDLRKTQEMIAADIQKIVTAMNNKPRNG
jgi:iron uptake system EfeUOB component EfeO/EfeM